MKIIRCVGIIGCILLLNSCTMLHSQVKEEMTEEGLGTVSTKAEDKEINMRQEEQKITIDVEKRKIVIPYDFFEKFEKNYWVQNEEIATTEGKINEIYSCLLESDISRLDINYTSLFGERNMGAGEEYPILLSNRADIDIRIDSLIEEDNTFYTELKIYGSKEQIEILSQKDVTVGEVEKDTLLLTCYLESEELFQAVKELWGERIYLNNMGEVIGAELMLNEKASLKGNISKFYTKEETEELLEELREYSKFINDTHPYGITILIEKREGEQIPIYFSEDGCAMFQLDGQNYHIESTIIESSTKRIKELKNDILELHEGD